MLRAGDKIAICACSDPPAERILAYLPEITAYFGKLGITAVCARSIGAEPRDLSPEFFQSRAEELHGFFLDDEIKAIFDISGGELANTLLSFLDFDIIKEKNKPFFGYSDLTVLLNAFYSKTSRPMYLYTVRNLASRDGEVQKKDFCQSLIKGTSDLFDFSFSFLRGHEACGTAIGGNIRCLLKLAGTEYFPDADGKILFLESLNSERNRLFSQLYHLEQLGIFEKISGIVLGTFTSMEKSGERRLVEEAVLNITAKYGFPLVSTGDIGHGSNSKCLIIGSHLRLTDK